MFYQNIKYSYMFYYTINSTYTFYQNISSTYNFYQDITNSVRTLVLHTSEIHKINFIFVTIIVVVIMIKDCIKLPDVTKTEEHYFKEYYTQGKK